MSRYGCKQCRKAVKPVKGKLTCCGITESVPTERKSSACTQCGGYYLGSAIGQFLNRQCLCNELAFENGEHDADEWG